jgi:hypothetical protein
MLKNESNVLNFEMIANLTIIKSAIEFLSTLVNSIYQLAVSVVLHDIIGAEATQHQLHFH